MGLAGFESHRYVSVETYRRDGRAVRTPVWFVIKGGAMLVVTRDQTGKVKRIKNNAKVRVAPCSIKGAIHGDWHGGTAAMLDADGTAEATTLRDKKYGFMARMARFLSRGKGGLCAFSISLD